MTISFNLALAGGIQSANGTLPADWEKGKLIFSHPFAGPRNPHPKHRHVVIYEQDDSLPPDKWLKLTDEQMALIREDESLSRRGMHRPRLIAYKDNEPVLYLVDQSDPNKVIFFGPTKMFRLPYQNVPLKFVDGKLRDDSMIDLPEAVFGFVRNHPPKKDETSEEAKQRAYAGRVFFSDALLNGNIAAQPLKMPKVLSAPKPNSFQNYLVQNAEDANDSSQLFHYNTDPNSEQTAIRGTKQYWHHQNAARVEANLDPLDEGDLNTAIDPRVRNSRTVIRPVPGQSKFTFTVRFENLSPEELGMLLWALSLPFEQPRGIELCHRLGMGKPLGLGSVKITPHLYLDNRIERYKSLLEHAENGLFCWGSAADPANGSHKTLESPATYLRAFEDYVTKAIDKQGQKLAEQSRIKDLIAMLRFPGPAPEKIADPGYIKKRKVLPSPREVVGEINPPINGAPARGGPQGSRTPGGDSYRSGDRQPQRGQNREADRPPGREQGQPPAITENPPSERTRKGSEDIMNFLSTRQDTPKRKKEKKK